jgi:Uma2 family endonuclease
MSSAIKILPHYTYEEYCQWEGRWEIIEGIPYAMSPAPVPRHQWVSANIKSELRVALKKSGCKNCKVYDFIDIKVAEDTVVQPDAVLVCKAITKPFLDFPAALVVEVLSPSTAMKDRNNKFFIYQTQKIPYYIIIDIDKNEVEVYHLKEDNKYQLEKISTPLPYTFNLEDGCSFDVILNNIWE